MIYRLAHRFARVEALGLSGPLGRVNDAADPLSLMIRITDAVDISNVIEVASTARPSSGIPVPNLISQLPDDAIPATSGRLPYRAATGLWSYDLTPALYQAGKQYNVSWRYEMTPGNLRVEHTGFIWNPAPLKARDSTRCILQDSVFDLTGTPQPLKQIIVEQYEDTFALSNRTDSVRVQTDIFGNWHIELPRKALVRILAHAKARVITIPDAYTAILSQLTDAQPADVRKDVFGYPL